MTSLRSGHKQVSTALTGPRIVTESLGLPLQLVLDLISNLSFFLKITLYLKSHGSGFMLDSQDPLGGAFTHSSPECPQDALKCQALGRIKTGKMISFNPSRGIRKHTQTFWAKVPVFVVLTRKQKPTKKYSCKFKEGHCGLRF